MMTQLYLVCIFLQLNLKPAVHISLSRRTVRSVPQGSLLTAWRGTCKRLHSRQAVLLNASACRKQAKWRQ